ncbi:MAG: hypothetical protein ACOYVF_00595 [Candidatus Zixiibacteriota bacterium]
MQKKTLKYFGLFFGVLLLVSMTVLPGHSQTYFYSSGDDDENAPELYLDLNSDEQDLADEYLDIIEQLKEIIEDYSTYLSDLDEPDACDDKINFRVFEKGLASGLYAKDIKALKEDIEYYIEDLTQIQAAYKKAEDTDNRHCYRISRSLNRELSILNNLIDQNISNRMVQKLKDKEFQLYLQESILKFVEKLGENLDLSELEKQVESLEAQFDELDIENLEIPAIPPMIFIPKTPDVAVAPPKVQTRVYIDNLSEGESGLAKVFTGFVTVSSSREPIHITNPVGDIIVNGKDIDRIEAELNIEISADSRVLEKNFVNATSLTVNSAKNGYYVTVSLPRLEDPQTKVLNSQLTVSLPAQNAVICENAYGRSEISNLQHGLTLNANYSEIIVSNIEGPVEITNSMNEIEIENVNGRLKVTNAYSPVIVSDCVGDINIANAYARVNVIGSDGHLSVNNSGEIEIENHTGDVDIDNSYGMVKVDNLFGNLNAKNAYSPIETREIRGSATLGNTYALIAATDIEGELKITNYHGLIDARYFKGPVDINNENGDVNVIITEPIRGLSRIYTSFGSMKVAVDESSDIWLTARTSNGDIQSAYPLELVDQGALLIGELKFGKAIDSLNLVGKNSTIIINNSR